MKYFAIILLALLSPSVSTAYEPTQTHPGLTEQSIEFYNYFENKNITEKQKELMIRGSTEEDTPVTRATNHFYDPIRNIGIDDGRTTKEWALDDHVSNEFSWGKALDAYAKGDEDSAFVALGHILHLVADMAVPDHTRNDQHLPFLSEGAGGGSPYEEWGENNKNRQAMRGLALGLKNTGVSIKTFPKIEDYFDFLANYSNRNFFSRDTIESPVYFEPKVTSFDKKYFYGEDSITNIKTKLFGLFAKDDSTFVFGLNDKYDTSILSSYFDRLSKQYVPAGAGVIKLFFQEGEIARLAYKEELRLQQEAEMKANAELAEDISQKGFFGLLWTGAGYLVMDNIVDPIANRVVLPIYGRVSNSALVLANLVSPVPSVAGFATVATAVATKDGVIAAGEWTADKATQGVIIIQQTARDIFSTQTPPPAPQMVITPSNNSQSPFGQAPPPPQVPIVPTGAFQAPQTSSRLATTGAGSGGGQQPMSFGGGSIQSGSQKVTVSSSLESTSLDVIPPNITLLGENPATSTVGVEYHDAGATALDDVDGAISVTASSTVDITAMGVYEVLYTVTDKAGNVATSTRIVHVIEDTTAPVIELLGDSVETIEVGDDFVDSGATAFDDTDGAVVVSATSTVDTLRAGEYSVVYTSVDRFGNRATTSRIVYVVLKPRKQINFLENNTILYGGQFVLCNVSSRETVAYGQTLPGQSFVSTETLKHSMLPGSKYRVIFGNLTEISEECNRGIYTNNVSNIFYYTDFSAKTYTFDPLSASFITSLDFEEVGTGIKMIINTSTHLITAVVPRGTDISSLTPRVGVSFGATLLPANGVSQDFTSPVEYVVKALDNSSHSYTINVVTQGEELKFDSNNFINRGGNLNLCDIKGRNISSAGIIYGGHISSTSWTTISQSVPNSGMTINKNYRFIFDSYSNASFDCANDVIIADSSESFYYTTPVGTSVVYGVYNPPPLIILSSEKTITDFSLQVATSTIQGIIDEAAHTISLTVPFGIAVTALAPTVAVSALATSSPMSETSQDFSVPVDYTITAEDGSIQVYTVTVIKEPAPPTPIILSSEKAITGFSLQIATSTVSGIIDESARAISLTVPFLTDLQGLVPTIVASPLATSTPASGVAQDFTTPVDYVITAEDGSTQSYVVTVVVEAPPVVVLPVISSYTFNGVAGDIVADFATTTPTIELSLVASKDVDWVSVTIEDQSDSGKYKRFLSGNECVDGTNSCLKTWDGILSGATSTAPVGVYRVKAHIKDTEGNDFNEYLSPYTIMVSGSEADL